MWDPNLGDVDGVIERALAEDLATTDITTMATVPPKARARAELWAKSPMTLCGLPVFARVFRRLDLAAAVQVLADEGAVVAPHTRVAEVVGNARAVLAAERTALNLVQRMSGVATLTTAYVEAAAGRCRITDTRKTTPGLRALERYAVRCGGGHNHRNDLGSGVLIKENHIRCAGGIKPAIHAVRAAAPHGMRIECEVTSLAELDEALAAEVDAVLLDNMNDDEVREAVQLVGGRAIIEVSGGITLERIPVLASLGIDLISVGALTHSAPAADLSLLVTVSGSEANVA
jgi:nicotinate-nucleotide pyrophosphorylase (carboxylating)